MGPEVKDAPTEGLVAGDRRPGASGALSAAPRPASDARALALAAARLMGVGAAYFVLAKAGLELASIHPSASPIWPPAGLALAAVLLWGYGMAPGIFVGALVANAITAGSLYTSAAIAGGNTLEALISAYLLNRWSGGRATFETPLGVAKFALVSLAPATMIAATIGVGTLSLAGFANWAAFGSIWKTWWLGDLAGALVVTPAIVLWARTGARGFAWRELRESVLLFAGTAAVGVVAFSPAIEQTADRGALAFLAILPLLWAALRRGPRDTATVAIILSVSAVWGTLLDGGPFARLTLNDSFLLLLAFMISAAVPSLALSAGLATHRRAAESLTGARTELERRVQERTAALVEANEALKAVLAQHERAELELRQQRVHLLEAQRLANLGSWVWDVAENRVTWSDTLFDIFGVRADAFAGTFEGFLARVHAGDRDRVKGVIEQAFRTGGDFRIEERIVRPDGEIRHLLGSGRAITDKRGNTVRLLGVCQDVTHSLLAQSALEEARQALHQAQKMEALGQLTGGIAHDFNNILTAITNSLELVRTSPGIDGAQAQRLERAQQAARNGAALVQQLLVFARKQPTQAQPADINEIVRATLTMLSRGASENIAIVTDLADDLGWARVDATQLQTAILNLAVNARDAMPEGGTLRIATANIRPDAAAAGPHRAPGFISVTVGDTGIGMPADVAARAFEPFFTTKEIGKGTGLGLSMVYSAMRLMGGDVTIASEPGKGTIVRLLLPAIDPPRADTAPEPARDAAAPETSAPGVAATAVLYVEDEALVRMATVDLLESASYAVRAAPDAEQALALLDADPAIALMVTDIGLPGMNGHELAAEARRRRPGLKVVFLTGYDRDKSGDGKIGDAHTRYLDKPYQLQDLFKAMRDLSAPG